MHIDFDKEKTTRPLYLLLEGRPPVEVVERGPINAIPPSIDISAVVEARPLEKQMLKMKGLASFIDTKKKTFFFPAQLSMWGAPRDEYLPLEEGKPQTVTLRFTKLGFGTWLLRLLLDRSFDDMEKMGFSKYDVDSMKQLMADVSPIVMGLTFFVSGAHLCLEFLSLASEVQFYREASSLEGLSPYSAILHVISSLFVLLFLMDEGDARIVQFFIVMKIFLDLWKLYKMGWSPFSKGEIAPVDAFERRGMTVLFLALLPVGLAFAAYQLVYVPQAGWYSWVVRCFGTLGYAGGLVAMTPQLFRNYFLKSVDALPWATLYYQAVNTFVDDIFSCFIRMPKMHRVSVFRDDVIFLIYHVQRWHYKRQTRKTKEAEDAALLETKKDK